MIKKILIPHKHNNHKPHLLRNAGAFVLVVILIASFTGITLQKIAIEQSDFLAKVIPDVLVRLANEERLKNTEGRAIELKENALLSQAAEMKAKDMAEKGYFAHNSPEGLTPWYWINLAGYRYESAGENLAVNFSDSDEVSRAWMDSPLHRANILNNGFTEIGIGLAKGTYEGRETTFVVQMFGRPTARSTANKDVASSVISGVDNTADFESTTQVETIEDNNVLGATLNEADDNIPVFEFAKDEAKDTALKVATSPSITAQIVYMILTSVVGFCLLLVISVEASRKHRGHLFIGIGLLIAFGVAIYIFKDFILGGVVVG